MAGRMYGERATELVRDLRRFDTLPPYNDAVVRDVIKEINALFSENAKTLQNPQEASAPEAMFALMLNHTSVHRNKRVILANFRLKKLQALRWDRASSVLLPEVQALVSEEEREFWAEYDRNVASYMREFPSLDLASELNIQVRVLKDHPDLVMQNGQTEKLQKNTLLYLPRADVEPLIKQGILEHCE